MQMVAGEKRSGEIEGGSDRGREEGESSHEWKDLIARGDAPSGLNRISNGIEWEIDKILIKERF